MTDPKREVTDLDGVLELLAESGLDGLAEAFGLLINEVMKLERSRYLRADPGERTESRRGYANGFKDRLLQTRVGRLDLRVPQVRSRHGEPVAFYPSAIEKGVRSERALKLSIAEMYVQGVSTRRVAEITKELCGLDISSSQVSRLARELDAELDQWRKRSLKDKATRFLLLDANYQKVRCGGTVVSTAVLIAVGVDEDGRRHVLGASVSPSEAEVHWRDFLGQLQERGLHGVEFVVSDDHSGLKAALAARLPNVRWQRCQFHLQRNAMAFVPNQAMRKEVAEALRSIFNATDFQDAKRKMEEVVRSYQHKAPDLAEWIEHNVVEGLTVLAYPPELRRRLRTVNGVERLNLEVDRRTRVAGLFPNRESLLRLVTAVLVEISEEWETGKAYLSVGKQ